jgi:hypothetical protein
MGVAFSIPIPVFGINIAHGFVAAVGIKTINETAVVPCLENVQINNPTIVNLTTPDIEFAPSVERLTGRPLAHAAMANARVLGRREQLIAHGSALTATSPLSRAFLDYSHVCSLCSHVNLMKPNLTLGALVGQQR